MHRLMADFPSQQLVCHVCHSTEFTTNDDGHSVCVDCGTQIVMLSQLEEANEDATEIARVKGHLQVLRKRKGEYSRVCFDVCMLFIPP